jgi:hypothetical protein
MWSAAKQPQPNNLPGINGRSKVRKTLVTQQELREHVWPGISVNVETRQIRSDVLGDFGISSTGMQSGIFKVFFRIPPGWTTILGPNWQSRAAAKLAL